jgi:hypothetical protein
MGGTTYRSTDQAEKQRNSAALTAFVNSWAAGGSRRLACGYLVLAPIAAFMPAGPVVASALMLPYRTQVSDFDPLGRSSTISDWTRSLPKDQQRVLASLVAYVGRADASSPLTSFAANEILPDDS